MLAGTLGLLVVFISGIRRHSLFLWCARVGVLGGGGTLLGF